MDLQTLLAEREIYRNLMAFARAMDAREWQVMESLLAQNAHADFGLGEVSGRGEIVATIRSYLDKCGVTQHLIANVVIDVEGTTARSRCYVSDMHLGSGDKSDISFRTLGEYDDEWSLVEGRWLLTRRVKDNRATVGSMAVFE